MQAEVPQDIGREALEALRWFVGRVESGEVYSRVSYAKFKEILDRCDGSTGGQPDAPTAG